MAFLSKFNSMCPILIKSAPVLLVFANKQDLPGSVSAEEIEKRLELLTINIPWHIQACSTLLGDGLFEGLEWLSNELRKCKNKSS